MKTLVATAALLCLVILLATLNLFYVREVSSALISMAESLPSLEDGACVKEAQRIAAYWRERERCLSLSIPAPFLDRIREETARLVAAADTKDLHGFTAAKALLCDIARQMGRAELISLENLF